MADKCIGRLTLDTKKIDEAVKHVNEKLAELGAGVKVDISKQVASEVKKQLDSVLKEIQSYEAKMSSAVDKAIGNAASKAGKKIDNSVIKQATQDLQEYYKWLTMAEKARGSGDISGEDIYRKRAESIRAANAEMLKNAEVTKAVADAETKYQQALARANEMVMQRQQKASEKAEAQAIKEKEQAVKEYIKALQEWYKAETDLNKELLSGNLQKGTEDYAAAREQVDQLGAKARDAGQKLTSLGVDASEATAGVRGLQQAAQALAESEDKLNSPKQEDYLAKAKQQYFELTDAIKNYNAAKKAGDETGMANAQARIDAAMSEVNAIQEAVNASNLEAGAKQQVLNYIQQCVTAEHQHTAEIKNTASSTGELESQVKGLVTRYLSLMAVIRTITSLINNMVDYVSEYSDKMNEIQMITMKTDAEVAQLADTYRSMAKDMSVSSLDMADAAIYFTRQGLGAAEIEKRLKNVTMYAKAANVEFENASEIITAVVNSMGLVEQEAEDGRDAAQRVADVFLNIGDHAATSGQEIGEAMQKAAASAGSFGVSMEWLAAYIATVSETTRQEARTIGTAFNTIIARLHQIKSTGYNQEDETRINDIAKALSKIDVALMDQDGNWRKMETILEEIAAEWGNLDGKTKSYIATTMAGVKQQNVFLALMNDMSKGIEHNSRAYELHELALNSNGVAAEKYSVYLDSVTAAQERLTVAQENFYALLNGNAIKGWYDSLAGIINFFTDATDKMNGFNIMIPVVIGGVWLMVTAFKSLAVSVAEAGGAMAFITAHPVIMAIAAVTAGIIALSAAGSQLEDATAKIKKNFQDASSVLSESQGRISTYASEQERLRDMIADVGTEVPMSSEKLSEYNGLLDELKNISPEAARAVEQLRGKFGDQAEAVRILSQEIDEAIKKEQEFGAMTLINKYSNWTPAEDTSDSGFSSRLANWGNGFLTDRGSFARGIQNYYNNDLLVARKHNVNLDDGTNFLTKEVVDEIDKLVAQYNQGQKEVDWGYIGDVIWSKFVGKGSVGDISSALQEYADEAINDVMSTIGTTMNEVERGTLRNQLVEAIMGSDGKLDATEYQNMGQNISKFVSDLMKNGFDNIEISPDKSLEYIGERIFGNYFELIFGDQFESLKNDPEFDVISGYITSAISELIEAGFNDQEIASVLETMDMRDWGSVVGVMKQKLRDAIKENANVDGLGISIVDLISGEETYDPGLWLDLDLSTLKLVNDMVLAGTEFEKIQAIMDQSQSVDEFKAKIAELADELGISGDEAEGAAYSFSNMLKEAKAGIKDIQSIDSAIESVKKSMSGDEKLNYGESFGLIDLHPEIMTVIGDSEKLLETLRKIRDEASKKQETSFVSMLLGSEGVIQNTKYADSGFNTLGEYRESIEDDEAALKAFDEEILVMARNLQRADENYKQMSKDATNATKEAQKVFNENVKEVETLNSIITKLQNNKTVDFSDIINLSAAHPEILAFANDGEALLEILQKLKAESKDSVKNSIKGIMMDSEDYFKQSKYYDPESDVKTMREYIDNLHEARGDWHSVAMEVDEAAANIANSAEKTGSAAESWLEAQAEIARVNEEVNWAKSNHFADQINELQSALDTKGIQGAIGVVEGWTEEMQNAVLNEYPQFIQIIGSAKKALKEQGEESSELAQRTNELKKSLAMAEKLNNVKYFKDSAKAIKELSEGTISATDAYDAYDKEVNKVTKAYEDILDVQNKMAYNAKEVNKDNQQAIDAADVSNLASLIGMTTDEVLSDFPAAEEMFYRLTNSAGELTDVLNMLNEAAFIRITGESEADFSNVINGLHAVQADAKDTIDALIATGQWEVATTDLPQEGLMFDPKTGGWTKFTNSAQATFLKPSGKNPFKGLSTVKQKADTKSNTGRRGGGGGGGSSNSDKNNNFRDRNVTTEVERMLDIMSQINTIQGAQQSWYQSQQKYFGQTKQLQGVIAYMQREKEALEAQNPVLEKNIKQIEHYMEIKRAEIATLSTDDAAYKDVADDLDKLQKAHQTYTKQLIDNKTAIEQLTESMLEQQKKIRKMEIDLRNTILKAIEDRERKREDMLNAEIQMENKIFDLVKRRYEKERDEILNTTQTKIDALTEERDLLQEQLDIRKAEAEEADKAAQLKELEVKYQRIIADPTRAKEAQSIKKQIDDLRKEMAWDLAQKEVEAQQDSIDQQVTSLEDYKEYVTNYYEDLFEHPQKLIEEMRGIMMGTQDEIIAFLKANDEEYQNSSENTRTMLVEGWNETYEQMRGIIKTYWDEVEYIVSQGEDYIIEFLMNNSADYAKAGKLQAEAYVDEWKEQLDNLKKAHEQVIAGIAKNYDTIAQYTGSSSSSSSSSGSKGGSTSSSGSKGGSTTSPKYWTVNVGGTEHKFTSEKEAKDYRASAQSSYGSSISAGYSMLSASERKKKADEYVAKMVGNVVPHYKAGGLANYTGPAWVDGSTQNPERILSPYQTKLFESMVQALEQASRISVQPMQNYSNVSTTGPSNVSVGDIVVNVDNLDTDDDYEELARKVCETIMDQIGHTAAIGGLRIRSV